MIDVGHRSVLLGGFLTEDESIYPPSTMPEFTPITQSIIELWEEEKKAGRTHDLFVPMTHQLTPLDQQTGEALSKHAELKKVVPVLLAGHDHEMYIDEAGASTIVKVGCDAEKIGFVDIWWDAEGNVQSSVFAVPATEFPKEPECDKFGSQQDAFVENMMSGMPYHLMADTRAHLRSTWPHLRNA